MRIKNIDGLSGEDLIHEVDNGARFRYFSFTLSFLVITLKKNSGVYLVRKKESARRKAIPFILATLFLGWWGIPFGPKYALESLRTNFKGGKDVTDEVIATVQGHLLFKESQRRKAS